MVVGGMNIDMVSCLLLSTPRQLSFLSGEEWRIYLDGLKPELEIGSGGVCQWPGMQKFTI